MASYVDNEQENQASSAELLSKKRQKSQVRLSWSSITLDTWILEGASLVFSVACLISIYGILISYNGKPRPSVIYNISLNAIISVLATGCKSSLVFVVGAGISQLKWLWFQDRQQLSNIQTFEDASRGPLGSIALLFRLQGQSLASLGAIILILMLAFDPFVQQILSYPNERIVTATETLAAGAPQVKYYNDSIPVVNMTSAYYLGVWATDFDIKPTCPSGNCTWPSYESFGICSQCSDVTSTATLNCAMPPSNTTPMLDTNDYNGICEVVLPQGKSSDGALTTRIENGATTKFFLEVDQVWMVEEGILLDRPTYSGVKNPLLVLAHSTFGLDNNRIKNVSAPTEGVFIKNVTQCAFSFCTQEYNVHVTNGVATTEKSLPDFGRTVNITGPEFSGNSTILCWAPSQTPSDAELERHYELTSSKGLSTGTPGVEFTYCDTVEHVIQPGTFLVQYDILTGQTHDTCEHGKAGWECSHPETELSELINFGQILELGLDLAVSQVAASLTKTLLQNSNVTVPGTVYTNETMVRVQWAWMVLPTLLVILGNVFLLWTMYVSRKKIVWKSSVLAFLFHGLDDQAERDDCMAGSRMEKLAEDMYVQLHSSEDDARVMLREN